MKLWQWFVKLWQWHLKVLNGFGTWRLANLEEASDEELEVAAAACETLALASGILVILGLSIEVLEALFYLQTCPFFERWGAVIADVPVAVGVFGEIYFSAKGGARQSQLQHRSKDRLREATERTAEIQKLTEWRHITPEQFKQISDAIADKASTLDVLIEYERGDPEAYSYAREITQIFQRIKPSKIRFTSNQWMGMQMFGLAFEFHVGYDGHPIINAFKTAGVSVTDFRERDLNGVIFGSNSAPTFHVIIFPKVPPPMVVFIDTGPGVKWAV